MRTEWRGPGTTEGPVRWVLDAIAVLTLIGLVAAVMMHQRTVAGREALVERTITDLRRLELEIKYRAVTPGTALNELGWPVTVDAGWFEEDPPRNRLVTAGRVWVEVAGEADANLLHPKVRMTVDDDLAGFWYNPFQGIVRARVPVMVSDSDATALYNRINGTSLASLLEVESGEPRRAPTGPGRATDRVQAAGVDDEP